MERSRSASPKQTPTSRSSSSQGRRRSLSAQGASQRGRLSIVEPIMQSGNFGTASPPPPPLGPSGTKGAVFTRRNTVSDKTGMKVQQVGKHLEAALTTTRAKIGNGCDADFSVQFDKLDDTQKLAVAHHMFSALLEAHKLCVSDRRESTLISFENPTAILLGANFVSQSAASFNRSGSDPSLKQGTVAASQAGRQLQLDQFTFGAQGLDDDLLSQSSEAPSMMTPKPVSHAQRIRALSASHDAHGYEMLNDYTILDEIGSGASGAVMLALHSKTQEPFAIKAVSKSRKLKFGRALPHFDIEKEVAVMKKLRHKNIVRLHEVIEDPDENMMFLVMDYVPGGKVLVPRVSEPGEPAGSVCFTPVEPEERLLSYARQIAEGLRYLHKRNVVHRDIKPDNLLLDTDDVIRIADFGISEFRTRRGAGGSPRSAAGTTGTTGATGATGTQPDACDGNDDESDGSDSGSHSNAGGRGGSGGGNNPLLKGTPAFLAPECCRGEPMGPPADVWAFGATLFCMKFGRLPFDRSDTPATVRAILEEPAAFPPDCDATWRELLGALLTKDPAARMTLKAFLEHPLLRKHADGNSPSSPGAESAASPSLSISPGIAGAVGPDAIPALKIDGDESKGKDEPVITRRNGARLTVFSEQSTREINRRRSRLGFTNDLIPLMPSAGAGPTVVLPPGVGRRGTLSLVGSATAVSDSDPLS